MSCISVDELGGINTMTEEREPLKTIYKIINTERGDIKIYGTNEEIETYYSVPEWNEDDEEPEEETCFDYRGNTHFLSEFSDIHNKVWQPNPPEWMKEFNGYKSDSFFSGLLIKCYDDYVKVYTYIS
jgi:hypothetical protein